MTLGTTTGNVNRLVIDSFALHDAGEYMCMASDDSGASNIKSTVIAMEGKYLLSCVALRESTYTAFRERLSEKMCTRQFRKVIWDMIDTLFLTTVAVEHTFESEE